MLVNFALVWASMKFKLAKIFDLHYIEHSCSANLKTLIYTVYMVYFAVI